MMKVLMLMLILICCSFVMNAEKVSRQSNDIEEDVNYDAISVDVLNNPNCVRLQEKGFCKYSFIKDKLCYSSCRCKDILTKKSCKVLKLEKNCGKTLASHYCKLTCGFCSCKSVRALGMASRAIPDSRITASSTHSSAFLPQQARLHYNPPRGKGGSWAAKYNRAGQWLQVDLGRVTKVAAVATQGQYDASQWVSSYTLQYSINGRSFKNYQGGKVFAGNKDRHTVVKHALHPFITARYIRLVVRTWYGHLSMRMELYECKR